MILVARFRSFCSWLISIEPAQPQTTKVPKVGLNNTGVKSGQTCHMQKDLACLKEPVALETLVETVLTLPERSFLSILRPEGAKLASSTRSLN